MLCWSFVGFDLSCTNHLGNKQSLPAQFTDYNSSPLRLFGHSVCNICLCLCFLERPHVPGDAEIILGSEWVAACSATLCHGGADLEFEDPTTPVIGLLLAGYGVSTMARPLTNLRLLTDTHALCVAIPLVSIVMHYPNLPGDALFCPAGQRL